MRMSRSDTHWGLIHAISWGGVPPLAPVRFFQKAKEARIEDVGDDRNSADVGVKPSDAT